MELLVGEFYLKDGGKRDEKEMPSSYLEKGKEV
jgi:hypothetical protein